MRPWVMPGHGGGGESTNRLRAESTESTESFQPHFMGEEQIRRKTVTEITLLPEPKRSKLSVLSVHSAAPPDAQRGNLHERGAGRATGILVCASTQGRHDQQTNHVAPPRAASSGSSVTTARGGWGFLPDKLLWVF